MAFFFMESSHLGGLQTADKYVFFLKCFVVVVVVFFCLVFVLFGWLVVFVFCFCFFVFLLSVYLCTVHQVTDLYKPVKKHDCQEHMFVGSLTLS